MSYLGKAFIPTSLIVLINISVPHAAYSRKANSTHHAINMPRRKDYQVQKPAEFKKHDGKRKRKSTFEGEVPDMPNMTKQNVGKIISGALGAGDFFMAKEVSFGTQLHDACNSNATTYKSAKFGVRPCPIVDSECYT